MPPDPVAAYQARYLALTNQLVRQIAALFLSPGEWRDAAPFIAQAVPLVEGAQLTVARLVDGYTATVAGSKPVGLVASEVTDLRIGTTTADVYRRPFETLWSALADDKPLDVAVKAGADRLAVIAQTDVILAQRQAMATVADQSPRIVGYRRTLTGKGCVLCAVASTQRYRSDDLMPIHDRCDCGVAPIYGTKDPGRIVNRKVLDNLQAGGPDYWRQRGFVNADGNPVDPASAPTGLATVTAHDELGPYLTHAA